MIHLCVKSPFAGYEEAMLYGKGPSLDEEKGNWRQVKIAVNDAAKHVRFSWWISRDWTAVERLYGLGNGIVAQSAMRELEWKPDALYFNDRLVLGQDVESKSVPGRMLGVGTATAALQLLAEAGVKRVYLNGFDAFWGGTIEYGKPFQDMGLSHEDYAEAFPASGSPEEQAALVRESMQHVIERKGVEVVRA